MTSNSMDVLKADLFGYESLLDPQDWDVIERTRTFMASEVDPIATEYWMKGEFPSPVLPAFAKSGLAGLGYEQAPASPLLLGFVGMEMARVDCSFGTFWGGHNGLLMGTIALLGSPEQRQHWLPPLSRLELIGTFALTEPDGGSDVARGMRTTARRDGDSWVLNGAKRWIGNATFADVTVIWARDVADDQVKAFLVPRETEGFSATKIEQKLALRMVENADITLTECRVPEQNRLTGANSFADTNAVLEHTRTAVSWSSVGCQMGAYDLAVAYAAQREQFGRPIGHFQLMQELLAKMLGNITASLGMAVRLAQLQQAGQLRAEQAALAKMFTTTRLRETVAWARELHGGNGIVADYGVGRFFADAEAIYSYEGTYQINALIVGRSITGRGAFL